MDIAIASVVTQIRGPRIARRYGQRHMTGSRDDRRRRLRRTACRICATRRDAGGVHREGDGQLSERRLCEGEILAVFEESKDSLRARPALGRPAAVAERGPSWGQADLLGG